MLMSIKLVRPVNISIDSFGKFMLDETKMSIKDVPFVRYSFESYGDEAIDYIKSVIEKFPYSGHLVEIKVRAGYIEEIVKIRNSIGNTAIFAYIDIDDTCVLENDISNEQKELVRRLKGHNILDRLMLKDSSKSLHIVSANKIRDSIFKECGIKDIGICSSPLSFGQECCLTAERARQLAAKYCDSLECALPTANHEGTNTCGCIRYITVSEDIKMPDGKKTLVKTTAKDKKEKDTSTNVEDKKEKVKKLPKNVMRRW